jgi:hypothetical protein
MSSTHRSYFDGMYASDPDPWAFETSAYEQRKYLLTMASLPSVRYRSGFEPGCSIGVLTEMLAARCDRLLAFDVVAAACEKARHRLLGIPHVTVVPRAIPKAWPTGWFDLIVLSEIAYYFSEADLSRVISLVVESTEPGAHVVGVHWRGETNYPLSGDRAHVLIDQNTQLQKMVHHREATSSSTSGSAKVERCQRQAHPYRSCRCGAAGTRRRGSSRGLPGGDRRGLRAGSPGRDFVYDGDRVGPLCRCKWAHLSGLGERVATPRWAARGDGAVVQGCRRRQRPPNGI